MMPVIVRGPTDRWRSFSELYPLDLSSNSWQDGSAGCILFSSTEKRRRSCCRSHRRYMYRMCSMCREMHYRKDCTRLVRTDRVANHPNPTTKAVCSSSGTDSEVVGILPWCNAPFAGYCHFYRIGDSFQRIDCLLSRWCIGRFA